MFNTQKLIELVRARRVIYDITHIDYRNRQKKAQAWKEVAAGMGYQNGEYWTLKWKSLKDNYTKFKKNKRKTEGPQNYNKYRNWPWAEFMTFLDHHTWCAAASTSPSQCSESASQDPIITCVKSEKPSTSKEDQKETDDVEFKRRKLSSPDVDPPHYMEHSNPHTQNYFDEVDLFFLSYAQNFKRLSPKCQALMKLEIASLFTRFELNEDMASEEVVKNSGLYALQSISSIYSDSNRSNNDNDDSNAS